MSTYPYRGDDVPDDEGQPVQIVSLRLPFGDVARLVVYVSVTQALLAFLVYGLLQLFGVL